MGVHSEEFALDHVFLLQLISVVMKYKLGCSDCVQGLPND